MSILKSCWLCVVTIVSLIGIYHLYVSPVIWGIVLLVITPLAISIAVCKFLKDHDYSSDYMDAEWNYRDTTENF